MPSHQYPGRQEKKLFTDIEFGSNGEVCRGRLYLPSEKRNEPYPTIVMAGGWCYVKEIVMPHYADYFVKAGYAVLLFDYRNFGESGGNPRQHIDPWQQIEDYRNAISYVETRPELNHDQIIVWGISYSGGHALIVGSIDPRVKGIISNIPVVDGYENMRRVHGESEFSELRRLIMEDRKFRFKTGGASPTKMPMSALNPKDLLSTWPFPSIYAGFEEIKKKEAPRHEHWSTVESVELLLNYTVFPFLRRIVNIPTLMLVAEGDDITLWDIEIEAFRQIVSQDKKLFVLPDTSHMSLYGNMSKLELAATVTVNWLKDHVRITERTLLPH